MESPVTRLMRRHLSWLDLILSVHTLFWSGLSGCFVAVVDHTGTLHRSEALVQRGPRKQWKCRFFLLWFVTSGEWLIWHSRSDCRVLGGGEEFSNTTSDLSTENCKNSPANMVYCDCCQVKPKPLLWLMESLLDGWLLLFYPPPVLPIGQRNCPPAPFGPLGSSSPGTPSASLAADKSVQITSSQNEWMWKEALMFFWFFTVHTDHILFSSSVLLYVHTNCNKLQVNIQEKTVTGREPQINLLSDDIISLLCVSSKSC